jgi:AcrR family transcriptional regulator
MSCRLCSITPGSRGAPADRPGDREPADGRVARSYRSRRAIIDAMRALHAEGDLRPTAPRVAERAGVSLRTVWQQFADTETLLVEANRRDDEILRSLMKNDAVCPPRLGDRGADRAARDRAGRFGGLDHAAPQGPGSSVGSRRRRAAARASRPTPAPAVGW